MQYIVTMRRKRGILFNFWLAEKNTNTYEIDFSKREGGRERKVEVGELTSQNNNE